MKAVVLAAGKGTRLLPLTKNKPKALVELKGKTLLEHVLFSLSKAGVTTTAIVTGYLGETIEAKFGMEFEGMSLRYIKQKEQLGTASAIALAKEFVGEESFICCYTDVVVESSVYKKLADDSVSGKTIVVGRKSEEPWRFGVLKIEAGNVTNIVEKPKKGEEPGNIINAGIYLFTRKIFDTIAKTKKSSRNEFEITDSIKIIASKNGVKFQEYTGACFDIGTIKELKEAEATLDSKPLA